MKKKLFYILILLFLCGCKPDILEIINSIFSESSEFIYITNGLSINDEIETLKCFKNTMDDSSQRNSVDRAINSLMHYPPSYCFRMRNGVSIPNPCPDGEGDGPFNDTINISDFRGIFNMDSTKYIVFFSRSKSEQVNININNISQGNLKRGYYLKPAKLRIIPVSFKRLNISKGDTIQLDIPVTYMDSLNNLVSERILYKKLIK